MSWLSYFAAFSIAADNHWTLTATADLKGNGRPDVLVGAMDLGAIAQHQRGLAGRPAGAGKVPLLLFENRVH